MTEQLVFRLPDVPKDVDPRQHVVSLLRVVGLNPSDAQRLVDDELEIAPVTGIGNLTKLLEGRYSEGGEWIEASAESEAAGAKLLALLRWDGNTGKAPEALTPEEKELVLVRNLDVMVRAGFIDRVGIYTKNKQQVQGIFKALSPSVNSVNFKSEGPDTRSEKTRRMIAPAAEILGVTTDFTNGE